MLSFTLWKQKLILHFINSINLSSRGVIFELKIIGHKKSFILAIYIPSEINFNEIIEKRSILQVKKNSEINSTHQMIFLNCHTMDILEPWWLSWLERPISLMFKPILKAEGSNPLIPFFADQFARIGW